MNKLYDLAVATRKYTTNDGQDKTIWLNIGAVIQGDKNPFMMIKAHFNPAGITRKENSESIVISMFAPKDNNQAAVYVSEFEWIHQAGTKLYDIAVPTRNYTTNDGQSKTVWENIGAVIMGEKNPYIMLKAHFNPAAITRKEGSESITVSLFKPKGKDETPETQSSGYGSRTGTDSLNNFVNEAGGEVIYHERYENNYNSGYGDDVNDVPF